MADKEDLDSNDQALQQALLLSSQDLAAFTAITRYDQVLKDALLSLSQDVSVNADVTAANNNSAIKEDIKGQQDIGLLGNNDVLTFTAIATSNQIVAEQQNQDTELLLPIKDVRGDDVNAPNNTALTKDDNGQDTHLLVVSNSKQNNKKRKQVVFY